MSTLKVDTITDLTGGAPIIPDVTANPTGTVVMFAGATVPDGWLECNGQAAGTELAAVLGQANVPDLRGEFVRGLDSGRGVDTGRSLGSFQDHQFQDHKHSYNYWNQGSFGSANAAQRADTSQDGLSTNNASTGNRGAETRPRNIALYYIIKT